MTNNPSVVFTWSPDDFEGVLASCETDGVFDLVKKYVPQEASVLESGCGLGRYVRYLQDRGWSIIGLEYSHATIEQVKKVWPDLYIVEGDAANSPFKENEFDAVLSLELQSSLFLVSTEFASLSTLYGAMSFSVCRVLSSLHYFGVGICA